MKKMELKFRHARSGQIGDSGSGERFGSGGKERSIARHQEVKL